MSELILLFVYCALLGSVVGFLAGLLGIGGGLVIVPVLSSILLYFNVLPPEQVVIAAVATSLASILFTSTSSAIAHHKNGNVPWDLAPWIMTGVALGALISGFLAALLPENAVRIVFAVSVVLIAIKMFYSSKNESSTQRQLPNKGILTVLTTITGGLSAMIGIGGGALLVPLLTFFSVDMKKAIGCASACGIVIALFGSVGYISSGSAHFALSDGFAGFVYLPALLGIVCTSWFTAPMGAKATHHLPVATIKKVFAVLLLVMAVNMAVN
ncbi:MULTISPECIES: sulfite exporter TauE/SafE family protein [Pseudoalteromonas]|uniref:sulfite exporter TauE/SafE family protein n=1 Tax=Pseudoalteromonas TaxID=53246 RepID=UPI00029B2798|nr:MULTISPECIES: sulfite exporter TauE/SafE family protein [Pseudoalteromonas]AUJ72461.1 Sulfite exporter TauE/SafE [Pseudoalteromonas sp. NC201]KJY93543.1 permease [Pseudoalteromonas piscicida]MBR8844311.1 sulfite exporter TauE/SafE family protein [Pseudoalteromonas sp. JC3]MCF2828144.1 sulfite exporter TauE/SafE family protein [Pseudoalteromonas sp. OF5H-5]MCF2833210.1 sulfite exporter TauE/SafE family protein [Pseudoalteromonas sp. DL2-H6]